MANGDILNVNLIKFPTSTFSTTITLSDGVNVIVSSRLNGGVPTIKGVFQQPNPVDSSNLIESNLSLTHTRTNSLENTDIIICDSPYNGGVFGKAECKWRDRVTGRTKIYTLEFISFTTNAFPAIVVLYEQDMGTII